jgi:hypothetical protein
MPESLRKHASSGRCLSKASSGNRVQPRTHALTLKSVHGKLHVLRETLKALSSGFHHRKGFEVMHNFDISKRTFDSVRFD